MKIKEKVAQLKATIKGLTEKQAAALASADAEGCPPEDRTKHLAEFDRLEAEKAQAKASLTRAEQLLADENTPAEPEIRPQLNDGGHGATAGVRVPAQARRHAPLRAFRGDGAVQRAERAGMWAAAAFYGSAQAAAWCRENGVTLARGTLDDTPAAGGGAGPMAVLSTTDNARAGYFVPDEVEFTILELAEVFGVFRRLAEVVPMGSGTKRSPRWTAGMTAYWHGEGNKPTSSDPAWDMVELVAKNLGAMTKMTRQLDEDSVVNLGDKVAMAMAEAFAIAEDQAGFLGDGTSTYGGITGLLTKVAADSVAYKQAASGNTTPETLDLEDFLAVTAYYPSYPSANPVWLTHKSIYARSMQRLQLNAGGNTTESIAAGGRPMFLGYPVEFVNAMPKTTSAGDTPILFGDLRLSSKVGNRRGRTMEVGFENDDFTKQLMTILGTARVDINNHTIVDPRNASNPGPVVGLKLAGS